MFVPLVASGVFDWVLAKVGEEECLRSVATVSGVSGVSGVSAAGQGRLHHPPDAAALPVYGSDVRAQWE